MINPNFSASNSNIFQNGSLIDQISHLKKLALTKNETTDLETLEWIEMMYKANGSITSEMENHLARIDNKQRSQSSHPVTLQTNSPSLFQKIWNVIKSIFSCLFSCKKQPTVATQPLLQKPVTQIPAQQINTNQQSPSLHQTSAAPIAHSKADPHKLQLTKMMAQTGRIEFYDKKNTPDTEWMGNFSEHPVVYNGIKYRTSEAAFQAQKFFNSQNQFVLGPAVLAQFQAADGDAAFRLARQYKNSQRQDWVVQGLADRDQYNFKQMEQILKAKIADHPELKEYLLATGDAYLVEHNPVKGRDNVWSDDNDGTGKNLLGQIWMEIRGEIGGKGIVNKVQPIQSVSQKAQNVAACKLPGCMRPCYIDLNTKAIHDYCGRTHAQQAKKSQ